MLTEYLLAERLAEINRVLAMGEQSLAMFLGVTRHHEDADRRVMLECELHDIRSCERAKQHDVRYDPVKLEVVIVHYLDRIIACIGPHNAIAELGEGVLTDIADNDFAYGNR